MPEEMRSAAAERKARGEVDDDRVIDEDDFDSGFKVVDFSEVGLTTMDDLLEIDLLEMMDFVHDTMDLY